MSIWGDQQWFKARLPGLSDACARKLSGSLLDRAREKLRPFVERASYTYHKERQTPLGIHESVFKCCDGPMHLLFSCHHHTPPDTFGFCFSIDLRPTLFGKRVPAHRMSPEQELARILERLRNAGITARRWDVIAEDDDQPC